MALFVIILWVVLSISLIDGYHQSQNLPCDGQLCQKNIVSYKTIYNQRHKIIFFFKQCELVLTNKLSGNLCTDLCATATFKIPNCFDEKFYTNGLYKYYNVKGVESSYVCPAINSQINLIEGQITIADLEYIFTKKISQRLHHLPSVEKVVRRLLSSSDVNRDGKVLIINTIFVLIFYKLKICFFLTD